MIGRLLWGAMVTFLVVTASAWAQPTWPMIPNASLYSMRSNQLDRAKLYAGSVARLLYRSNDGGQTWDQIAIGSLGGASRITALYVHPRDTGSVFAGGIGFDGVERTTDGGVTWNRVISDPEGARFNVEGDGIAAHPFQPDTMLLLRTMPPIVYRSVNAGATWDSLSTIPVAQSFERPRSLTIAPDDPQRVIVGAQGGWVYMSTDGGKTFAQGNRVVGLQDADIVSFRWVQSFPGMVFCAVRHTVPAPGLNIGGVHVSVDYGVTWTPSVFTDPSFYALCVYEHANGVDLYAGTNHVRQHPWATSRDSAVFRSTDLGATWTPVKPLAFTSDENGDTLTNIYGIEVAEVDGLPHLAIASQSGGIGSTTVTSILEASNTRRGMELVNAPSGVRVVTDVPLHGDLRVVVTTIDGRIIRSESMTVQALTSYEFSLASVPSGLYAIRAVCGDRTASLLCYRQ
jgi:photosystem II stability/assembly factor-like uncharacterized protein